MHKILVTTILLSATISATAQTSVKTLLDKFPALPSANTVITFDKQCRQLQDGEETPSTLSDYRQSVIEKEKEIAGQLAATTQGQLEQSAATTLAEKVTGLNITKGQMAQMNQEQQQAAAMQSTMSQLSSMGLSASDLAKIQNGTMTEADQQALVNKMMMKASGGVSVDDVKLMENMTDAQRAAYMQQKGMTQAPTQQASAPKGKISSQQALQLQALQQKGIEAHQKSLQMCQLKETIAGGESLWQQKYANGYKKLNAEFMQLVASSEDNLTDAQRNAVDAKIKNVTKQMRDMESAFYAEYIPKYHGAIQEALNYVRTTMTPAIEEWKKAYDEAYKQTGEQRWLFTATNMSLPIATYSTLLQKIETYNLNSKGEPFESSSLE